jgi:outer membrane protein assembly factor BamA
LRGFDYNIRNGSTFALLNAELRIPFLKYISRRPIKISFLRHLQVVGFADVGAAWEGVSPFDEDNPINILHLENPPTVRLKVNYYRDPLVVGYGVGVRTMLFGYFLRLDYAWGLETRIVQKPKLHFALGLDF